MTTSSRKIKVLVFKSDYGKTGGAETLLSSILRYMDSKRFRITLIIITNNPDYSLPFLNEEINNASIDKLIVPWQSLISAVKAIKRLRGLLSESEADIIYTHDMRSNLVAFFLSHICKIPWVAHVHGRLGKTASWKISIYEKIDQILIFRADTVIVGSENLKKRMGNLSRHTAVEIIPNSIDTDWLRNYRGDASRLRASLFPNFEGHIIGSISRLHRGKGIHILLQAFSRLKKEIPDIRCIIVGEGPQEKELKELVEKTGIVESVVFTGYCEDIVQYLSIMDIFVVCSFTESLPISMLEAMAMGKPVIATDVGDIGHVLDYARSWLIVKPADIEGLMRALKNLLNDPASRMRLGLEGKDKVKSRYSTAVNVKNIENILAGLLNG